ncbi:MAG: ogr/Delta-like zinc finger family protein [Proteobacteria bacterium]|nr:ogr/Delta-like zinc finger family protein [Pseudomonadota bacterium]
MRSESRRLACPHCGWSAAVRTSETVSDLTRQTTYSCSNFECGHNFKAIEEIVVSLTPSATPNPAVHLPLSSHVQRRLIQLQLDSGRTVPYTPINTPPRTGDLFEDG